MTIKYNFGYMKSVQKTIVNRLTVTIQENYKFVVSEIYVKALLADNYAVER